MALSEYMPYGAPELLDAAPERMARSTLVASLGVALLVVSLGAVLSRSVTHTFVVPDEIPAIDLFDLHAPRDPEWTAPLEVTPAEPSNAIEPNAEPVLKQEVVVPPDDLANIVPPDARTGDGPIEGRVPSGALQGAGPATEPQPNEFVYTDQMPALVEAPKPRFPDLAREAGVEGIVTVRLLVGLDGRVLRAIIAPRGSVLLLDEAALEAARLCVFTPALANGHPVKVWVSQQYRFRLH